MATTAKDPETPAAPLFLLDGEAVDDDPAPVASGLATLFEGSDVGSPFILMVNVDDEKIAVPVGTAAPLVGPMLRDVSVTPATSHWSKNSEGGTFQFELRQQHLPRPYSPSIESCKSSVRAGSSEAPQSKQLWAVCCIVDVQPQLTSWHALTALRSEVHGAWQADGKSLGSKPDSCRIHSDVGVALLVAVKLQNEELNTAYLHG